MPYIGKNPTVGNFVKLDAITTSATATYNLTNGGVAYSPQSANHCLVSLNGVIQEPTSASNVGGFTISGSTIVFTSALTSLDVIDFILVLGDVLNIGTPSDGTVGFSKVTSNLITGATAETSIAGGDSVLIYDDSASALRKMTRTNFVSGLGGLSEADLWTLNGNQTLSSGTDVTVTPFARPTYTTFGYVGTGMTHSSGIFTFPSTGYYQIIFSMFINRNGSTRVEESNIQVSTDSGSTYSTIGQAQLSINQVGSVTYQGTVAESFVDVTNASTFRIRFRVYSDNGNTLMGADLTKTQTHATFIKLAET